MNTLPSQISTSGLAKILLIQSIAIQLPDEATILDFVCRGLEDMPGAGRVYVREPDSSEEQGTDPLRDCFPVQLHGKRFAELIIITENQELFGPYRAYIENLCFTVAVIFEERRLQREIEEYHRELEQRVEERTRQLSEYAREREAAEAQAVLAMQAAEEANRSKDQFLANMSHELRTPLTAIMAALDLLKTGHLNAPARQQIMGMANDSASRLLRIISDLLDFANLDAGRTIVEEQPLRLLEFVRETVETFAPQALGKGLELTISSGADLPDEIITDSLLLRQVLTHLVGNALKFTTEGTIEVAISRETDKIAFAVRDTGIGITPEKYDQIFQAFTQVDGSFTRPYGGTGLGLAISKNLVELIGGKLWLESESGRGSTFYFTLPLKEMRLAPEPANPAGMLSNVRVLLVEDDPMVQNLLQLICNREGLQVVAVADGLQAVMLCEKESFDLILMDLQMPKMDGLEAARKIREMEAGQERKTCIFALTAHARAEDREKCLRAGMDGFLTKPFQIKELESLIRNCTCFAGGPT